MREQLVTANLVQMHGNGGMRYFMRQHLVNANLVTDVR